MVKYPDNCDLLIHDSSGVLDFSHQTTQTLCRAVSDSYICNLPNPESTFFSFFIAPWIVYAALAVFISLFFVAVMYIVGAILNNDRTKAWAKEEIYQALFSFGFLFLVIPFLAVFCSLNASLFGLSTLPVDILTQSCAYFVWLRCKVLEIMHLLYWVQSLMSLMGSFSISHATGGIGVSNLTPYAFMNYTRGFASIAMSTLIIAYITLGVQSYLFAFIAKTMFPIFLPIGLILRTFGPTRKFGGALIGLAVGLTLFYPFLVMMNFAMVVDNPYFIRLERNYREQISTFSSQLAEKTNIPSGVTSNTPQFVIDEQAASGNAGDVAVGQNPANEPRTSQSVQNPPSQTDMDAASQQHAYNILNPLTAPPGSSYLQSDFFLSFIVVMVGYVIIACLFLPTLNFLLLTMAVKDLSKLFGEPVDISLLTRLI